MQISMVWAEGRDGAIGRGGAMPWHLPEDLAHFKEVTLGLPVIMGRRTWESLPERFRPLPGRENVVVSRDAAYVAEGATVLTSLDAALQWCEDRQLGQIAIIGGEQVFREAMPIATTLEVTRIALDVPDADTFAPEIGLEWVLAESGADLVSKTGLGYRFERWVRAAA